MTGVLGPDGLPVRPVDPDWLALREPADVRSRDATADVLLPPLVEHLRARVGGGVLRVVDLGAGTGANQRWLAPRLAPVRAPGAQRWTFVDHDPRLPSWGPAPSRTVRADAGDLPRVLADTGGADLVTAAALLDLLDSPTLAAVVRAVTGHGVPALFSLSVTGAVRLDPAEPLDADLAAAFDAHQRRDGRLGPDAGGRAAAAFAGTGWRVIEAATPWLLGPGEPALLAEWAAGRAEAAVEWQPDLSAAAAAWLGRRRHQAATGTLSAAVDHVDVLALPPPPP